MTKSSPTHIKMLREVPVNTPMTRVDLCRIFEGRKTKQAIYNFAEKYATMGLFQKQNPGPLRIISLREDWELFLKSLHKTIE